MCIIIVKPEGNTLTKKTLENCFTNNDDGAGFMWYDKEREIVVGDKGYMSFQHLWMGLERKGFVTDEAVNAKRGVVIHCRIATHGGVQAPLTHPFPITANDTSLRLLNWEYGWGLAHNGTITGVTEWNSKTDSDTLAFVREYLADESILNMLDHEPFVKFFTFSLKASNKFAILTPVGNLILIGNFIKGQDGNIYSNSSFQEKVVRYQTNNWGRGRVWDVKTQTYIDPPKTERLTPEMGKLLLDCTLEAVNCATCARYAYYPSSVVGNNHWCVLHRKYLLIPEESETTETKDETTAPTTHGMLC